MEKPHLRQRAQALIFVAMCSMILAIADRVGAQALLPRLDDGMITYQSEPFQIDNQALLQGLQAPDLLREIIEGNTGLDLPGQVDGIYMVPRRGGSEELQACQIVCVGENGGEPCYNTCGMIAVGTGVQTLLPWLGDGMITYRSEPFQIDNQALLQGLQAPDLLREIIEGNTGLDLPGQVDGIYMVPRRGGSEELQACRIVCVGENGGEPCYNTCGMIFDD